MGTLISHVIILTLLLGAMSLSPTWRKEAWATLHSLKSRMSEWKRKPKQTSDSVAAQALRERCVDDPEWAASTFGDDYAAKFGLDNSPSKDSDDHQS